MRKRAGLSQERLADALDRAGRTGLPDDYRVRLRDIQSGWPATDIIRVLTDYVRSLNQRLTAMWAVSK